MLHMNVCERSPSNESERLHADLTLLREEAEAAQHPGQTVRADKVRERANMYGGNECFGSALWPVLGNSNVHDPILRSCKDDCDAQGDTEGSEIATALLGLTWAERCYVVDIQDPEAERKHWEDCNIKVSP